eukprot:354617-Chlamydomonas_euryale.AAC.10
MFRAPPGVRWWWRSAPHKQYAQCCGLAWLLAWCAKRARRNTEKVIIYLRVFLVARSKAARASAGLRRAAAVSNRGIACACMERQHTTHLQGGKEARTLLAFTTRAACAGAMRAPLPRSPLRDPTDPLHGRRYNERCDGRSVDNSDGAWRSCGGGAAAIWKGGDRRGLHAHDGPSLRRTAFARLRGLRSDSQ